MKAFCEDPGYLAWTLVIMLLAPSTTCVFMLWKGFLLLYISLSTGATVGMWMQSITPWILRKLAMTYKPSLTFCCCCRVFGNLMNVWMCCSMASRKWVRHLDAEGWLICLWPPATLRAGLPLSARGRGKHPVPQDRKESLILLSSHPENKSRPSVTLASRPRYVQLWSMGALPLLPLHPAQLQLSPMVLRDLPPRWEFLLPACAPTSEQHQPKSPTALLLF